MATRRRKTVKKRRISRIGGQRRPYSIEPLTPTEYETLRWLSARGYDAGILDAAGVEEELADGRVVLGTLSEPEAWQINENIEEDPHAFLTSNGSRGLATKLQKFLDSIV